LLLICRNVLPRAASLQETLRIEGKTAAKRPAKTGLDTLYVGMDVHKATISISIAEDDRNGPLVHRAKTAANDSVATARSAQNRLREFLLEQPISKQQISQALPGATSLACTRLAGRYTGGAGKRGGSFGYVWRGTGR
jgi:hypothetical protein